MSELLKPPAVPAAILNFFASQPDFPAVAGDISEEFHQRAQKSGAKAAMRWYWPEAFRNAFALTWRELMRTPIRTFVTALGCILAVTAVTALYAGIRFYFFQGSAEDLMFDHNQRIVLLLLNFFPSLAMGWIGGRLLPGREWALALMFTFVSACLVLIGIWYVLFVIGADPSNYMTVGFLISANVLRQGFFWLGCFLIRVHSRSFAVTSIAPSTPLSSPPRNPPDLS